MHTLEITSLKENIILIQSENERLRKEMLVKVDYLEVNNQ